ncbi:MAG: hypothetical protein NVS2B7_24350 [Herpetosiphon sp.]
MVVINDLMNPNPTLNLFFTTCTPRWLVILRRVLQVRTRQLLALGPLSRSWQIRSHHFAGRQTVAIDSIRGSESRVTDFDAAFRPTHPHAAERWCKVAAAWQQGAALPPVELIRVGDLYFVRDGHHRISVARTYGAREIDALVTVWDVDGPLPWDEPAAALPPPKTIASGTAGRTAGKVRRSIGVLHTSSVMPTHE